MRSNGGLIIFYILVKLFLPMFQVYVSRRVPEAGISLLRESCDIRQWDSDDPVPRPEFLAGVQGVDGVFSLLTDRVDEELLDAAGWFL